MWLGCRKHTEVSWYLISARNKVRETSGDLELVCNEAIISRGAGSGIPTTAYHKDTQNHQKLPQHMYQSRIA